MNKYGNTLTTLFTHCVDSEVFSGRNQSISCAVALVTIARDSESDCPFNPVGRFRRICAGHLGVRLVNFNKVQLEV